MIKDGGDRTKFDTGAVRDMHSGKGRMDLLPWYGILELSKHCEEGAVKYGEHNVDRGIPLHSLLDSGARHLAKYIAGEQDEDHLRAAVWNLTWALQQRTTHPELNDLPWAEKKLGKVNSRLRVPTDREYGQLVDVTGGDDSKMHWDRMLSWINDAENEYGLDESYRAYRGYDSARHWNYYSSGNRNTDIGFRPACDLPSETLASVRNGERMVMGTLYMGNEPVKVPQNPAWNGDIAEYLPGATLELREALDDQDYQVIGYRVGDAVIADRCLLKMISYEDIEANVVATDQRGLVECSGPHS